MKEVLGRRRTQSLKKVDESCNEIQLNMSAKCTGINVFAHTQHSVSAMLRVDSLAAQRSSKFTKMSISGTKCIRFNRSSSNTVSKN